MPHSPRPKTTILAALGTFAVIGSVLFTFRLLTAPESETVPTAPVRYGLSLDTLQIQDSTVPSGATFGSLLAAHGIDAPLTHRLVEACAGVFDVRRLRAGQPMHLAFDSTGRLRHLVYEPDALQWVRFDLDSVPRVRHQLHKVDTVSRTAGGMIAGSLWADLASQGHSPTLIARVADILAWQVDFFSVYPGDSYRILYDELQVDGKPVGLGDIQAVSFEQGGKSSEAFLFRHGTHQGYYDGEGHPAKRQFLKAPLQFARISSHFSRARMHPVLRIVRPHHGVDYAAPTGTPVMTVGDGTVLARGWDPKGGGNYVKVRHNATFTTVYMHLHGIASKVRVGGRVQQGEVLGWVGATGLATGPHLDFRFFRNGSPVNPLTVEPPPAPPLDAAILPVFLAATAPLAQRLEAVAVAPAPKPVTEPI